MFFKVLRAEAHKLVKSAIWMPIALTPIITLLIAWITLSDAHLGAQTEQAWQHLYVVVVEPYAMLLFPLLTGAMAALVCRMEHATGGWKLIHALPVRRSTFYFAKVLMVLLLLAVSQVLLLVGILFSGWVLMHLTGNVPWGFIGKGLVGGMLSVIPLAALQFWVASAWESFGAQFALSTILTIPGLAISHSVIYGPLYPWSQPILAMLPLHPGPLYITPEASLTIAISAVVLLVGSAWYFVKRDIA